MQRRSLGFTIVELLVVIVVIGILATITVVSYTGISNKAIIASIQSDLETSFKRLKLFQVENSAYPTSITDCPTPAAGNLCVKPSGSNAIASYVKDNTISPQGFCINVTNGTNSYKITSTTYPVPTTGDCNATPTTVNYATSGSYTWTVPSSVSSVQLEVWGAKGSNGSEWYDTGSLPYAGGKGGYAKGNLSVTAGNLLYINAGSSNGGGAGGTADPGMFGVGGAGGGASDVRYGGNALSDRKIVAGGGGGGGSSAWDSCGGETGGAGGGTAGGNGNPTTYGGNGGTQSSGYALGVGGPGAAAGGAGGGGAGYYGGYSGTFGWCAGGGGGSGYVGGVTSTTLTAGNASMPAPGGGTETGHAGTGYVRIIYTPAIVY